MEPTFFQTKFFFHFLDENIKDPSIKNDLPMLEINKTFHNPAIVSIFNNFQMKSVKSVVGVDNA